MNENEPLQFDETLSAELEAILGGAYSALGWGQGAPDADAEAGDRAEVTARLAAEVAAALGGSHAETDIDRVIMDALPELITQLIDIGELPDDGATSAEQIERIAKVVRASQFTVTMIVAMVAASDGRGVFAPVLFTALEVAIGIPEAMFFASLQMMAEAKHIVVHLDPDAEIFQIYGPEGRPAK